MIILCELAQMLMTYRDQELRFTVHDSPDYYQLKVSVFNDDRKTELIGETWVSLEQIILPGGGKQDQWHHLNCKGRFAGEIRIELTYYDTRPKELKAEDRRQSGTVNGVEDSLREGSCSVGGPRQPKPVKRRPLPSDPTMIESSRSSPLPFTPPPATQPFSSPQLEPQTPPLDYRTGNGLPEDKRHHTLDQGRYRSSHSTVDGNDVFDDMQRTHGNYGEPLEQSGHGQLSGPNVGLDDLTPTHREYENLAQSQNQHSHVSNGYSMSPQLDGRYDYSPNRIVPDALNMPNTKFSASLPQHASMPDFGIREEYQGHAQQYHRTSLPRQGDFEQNSVRQYTLDEGYNAYSPSNQALQDEAPPPPPVHRSSGLQSSPTPDAKADNYPLVSGPAPLNIRHARGSISASPLSQVHNNTPRSEYEPSGSPTTTRQQPQSFSSRSYHHSYTSPDRRHSPERFPVSPIRDYSQQTPRSLVPGYDPSAAVEESDRLIHEQQPVFRQASEPVPQYQAYATQRTPNEARPAPRNDVPLQLRMLGNGQAKRSHRASAPIIARREVSPDPKMPTRKSVSPQPGQGEMERRQSAVPFGPDSYDTFNPSLNDAASINSAGPKYKTPEEANEAQHEREREAKLAEGPIIGSDGREIDPSDHLPAETWAPEPESKAPKKKPEITIRFRRSPAGAQPMPVAGRRPTDPTARPGPQVTPVFAHSSDAISPTSAAPNRLQKKSRVTIAQPVSSPVIPTINSNIRGGMPRAASERPLREHENYGHNSSPTYARSPAIPPPIPGKVPLNANIGQEDWGMNALSEEMRRIDIGVAAGSARARRSRYGISEAGRY